MKPDVLRDLAILVVAPTDVGALFEVAERLDAQAFIDAGRFARAEPPVPPEHAARSRLQEAPDHA